MYEVIAVETTMPTASKVLSEEMQYALGHAVQHEETLFGDYKNVTPADQEKHGTAAAHLIAMLITGNEAARHLKEGTLHYWAWTGAHIMANIEIGDEWDWFYINADCELSSVEMDPLGSTPEDVVEFSDWAFDENQK